jgi:hypothetical protein
MSVACQRSASSASRLPTMLILNKLITKQWKIIIPARFCVPLCSYMIVFDQSQHQDFLNRDFEFSVKSLLLSIANTYDYHCALMYLYKLTCNLTC